MPCLPASPLIVALYLTNLLRTADSPSPVLTCSGAMYLHHQLAGLPSSTQHPLVSMSREIAKRIKPFGHNVKKPFLASHIRRLFEFWRYSPLATLFDLMRSTAVTLCFAGFLQFSDLMTVQWHEIRFFPTHMEHGYSRSTAIQGARSAWKSERVNDGYVVNSLQARLSVTANLGLQPAASP